MRQLDNTNSDTNLIKLHLPNQMLIHARPRRSPHEPQASLHHPLPRVCCGNSAGEPKSMDVLVLMGPTLELPRPWTLVNTTLSLPSKSATKSTMIRWSSTRRWPRCRCLSLFLRLDLPQIRSRRCRNGNHCQPSRRGKWKMEVFCRAAIASVGHCCCCSFWCVYCRCAAVGVATVAVVAAAIFVLAFARGAVAGSFGCCFLVCADDCSRESFHDDPLIYRQIPWFFTRKTIPWFIDRSLDFFYKKVIPWFEKFASAKILGKILEAEHKKYMKTSCERSLDFFLQK